MGRLIYLIRHGKIETEPGVSTCLGVTDIPLSPYGGRQAEVLGSWLAEQLRHLPEPPAIYTSPLSRCHDTARILAKVLARDNAPLPVTVREQLHEMDMGRWENLTFEQIRRQDPELYEARGAHLGTVAPPGGESFRQAGERMLAELTAICSSTAAPAILLVAHAGVFRSLLCLLQGWSCDRVMEIPFPHGGLALLEEGPDGFRVVSTGHKPSELLDDEEIGRLYREYNVSPRVRRHMEAVEALQTEILSRIDPDQTHFDHAALRGAALLHDIARDQPHHPQAGARILRKEGYHCVAALVEEHDDPEGHSDQALTAGDILYYADKRVQEDRVVTLAERFETSRQKCQTRQALEMHKRRYRRAGQIESRLTQRSAN